jgi:hypothetical protein
MLFHQGGPQELVWRQATEKYPLHFSFHGATALTNLGWLSSRRLPGSNP